MSKPTVALAMIVRNESHIIERCLETALPFIHAWSIIDTGSDDGTQDVVRSFFAKHAPDTPGQLLEEPWVDYSTNRNQLLVAARKMETDYLLLLDADHTIEAAPNALDHLDKSAYLVSLAGPMEYWMPYLISSAPIFEYRGVTHEYLSCTEPTGMYEKLQNFVLHHFGDGGNRGTKFDNDLTLLKHEYERDANNERTVFYLAQTFKDVGDWEAAKRLYAQRTGMGGWDEEVYWAHYQLASLTQSLDDLFRAVAERPSRPEATHELMKRLNHLGSETGRIWYYQMANQIGENWDYGRRSDDVLFVERWMEDYGIAFEHAIAAWWCGNIEKAKRVFLRLQEMDIPADYRSAVEQNLNHCP